MVVVDPAQFSRKRKEKGFNFPVLAIISAGDQKWLSKISIPFYPGNVCSFREVVTPAYPTGAGCTGSRGMCDGVGEEEAAGWGKSVEPERNYMDIYTNIVQNRAA